MSTKITVLAVTTAGITLAGCGGASNKAASRPTKLYTVQLSAAAARPAVSPTAGGTAIIAFHGSSTICWRFAHLHGFVNATTAHVALGPASRVGATALTLSPGPKLHHRGCMKISPALSKQIWASPRSFYVTVTSAQNPGGAVRAQL
ncbi:MAG: CHRD domain-containing protein [Solirubrobacteraceae bacterium]